MITTPRAPRDALDRRTRERRAGGIVRRAQVHDGGVGRDHAVDVGVVVRGQWHEHGRQRVHVRERRHHRKGRIGDRDTVAGFGEGSDRGIEHVVRSAAGHDRRGFDAGIGGDRAFERLGIDLRVSRHGRRCRIANRALRGRRHAPQVGIVAQVDGTRAAIGRVQREVRVARARAKLRRGHVRPPADRAAIACPGRPSPTANAATSGASAAAARALTR